MPSQAKTSAPKEILDLVARFEQQIDAYKSGQYNETQLRREFLDPFFKAIGWDIDNEHGYAEAYKDVVHEDAIRVGDSNKAPDYCFRIGGTRKFFLEAKKPSVLIKVEITPAYQLRSYAWSAKLPLDHPALPKQTGVLRPGTGRAPVVVSGTRHVLAGSEGFARLNPSHY